ncbi:MAG: hypothetical protein LPK45_10875, partial [Bacteroidota bacterium]|nr:hypothetical protein [Bacteroidota bacterium]MDX5470323.1 hypothetical protein [Bacteroidota bacterium]
MRAQSNSTVFGESKLQFEKHDWKFISSDNFDAYYYGQNEKLAEFSLVLAEEELKKVEELIDYRIGGRSQIILFESAYDLRHSNLYIEQLPFSPGGYTYAMQNKVVAVFDGNRNSLKKSVRYGIAELLVNELMYGGSFQERLRSSTLLYMPAWYYQGLLAYISEPWSTETDDLVRDALSKGTLKKLGRLSGPDAVLAGHSWWNYIVNTYGKRALSDLLYLTRVSRNYESALNFVIGSNANVVFKDWIRYYEVRYSEDPGLDPNRATRTLPGPINRLYLSQVKVSPDGKHLALSGNYEGRLEVWVTDLNGDHRKRIFKSDDRTNRSWTDLEPILSWDPKNNRIHLILHEKGKLKHLVLDISGSVISREPLPTLSGVQWMDVHPNDGSLLLSGILNGQTDLYLWKDDLLTPLTKDIFDDLYARFNQEGTAIYFSSNRADFRHQPPLPDRYLSSDSASLDIFRMNYPEFSGNLTRITHTDYIDEISPIPYARDGVAYLSDNNGIFNTYVTLSKSVVEKNWLILDFPARQDTLVIHGFLDTAGFTLQDLDLDPAYLMDLRSYRIQILYKNQYYHYPLSNNSRNMLFVSTDKNIST